MERDLQDLLMAWTGSEVSEERRAELLARLQTDAALRKAFAEELRLLGQLKAVQSVQPRWLRMEDELGLDASVSSDESALVDAVLEEIGAPKMQSATTSSRWLIAAAILVFASLAVWWTWLRPVAPQTVAAAPVVENAPGLAVLSNLSAGAATDATGRKLREGDVVAPGRLRLASGAATLTFFNGATLFLEGESELDLQGMDRVACQRGRLRVRMPEGATGFTITGPGMAVVDLGTEFGMNVATDGRVALRVFEGKVEASVLNRDGYTLRSELLEKDESAAIESGRIARDAKSSDDFAVAPSDAPQPLVLSGGYAARVKAARPWGYWRFETLDDGFSPNEIEGGPAFRAGGPVRLDDGQAGNHTLVFAPQAAEQRLLLDGNWDMKADTGYAVEFWMRPERIRLSAIVSLIADAPPTEPERHLFLLQLMDRSQRWLHPHGAIRFLHRVPAGTGGGVNIFTEQTYVPGRWHHIVAQANRGQLELYVNGRLAGKVDAGAEMPGGAYRCLIGRLKQIGEGDNAATRPFVGQLDELALYERSLTPQEIAQHAAAGGPPNPRQSAH